MDDDCEVVFVAGLGKMLGRTEASVREGMRRGRGLAAQEFQDGHQTLLAKGGCSGVPARLPGRREQGTEGR